MLTRLWLFLYEYSVYVISFGLVKVLTLSSREEYRERERKKIRIGLVHFSFRSYWFFSWSKHRQCFGTRYLDHVTTCIPFPPHFKYQSFRQLAFFYYSLLFVRLVEIVVNIIDLLISCTSYNWIIGQFAINYLFFYRLYSRLIYTRWKKKKRSAVVAKQEFFNSSHCIKCKCTNDSC